MTRDILKRAFFPMFYHKREADQLQNHKHWTRRGHLIGEGFAIFLDVIVLGFIAFLTFLVNIFLGVALLVFYQVGIEFVPKEVSRIYRRFRP